MRWHIPHEEEHLELFSMATLQLQGTATAAVLSISEAAGPEMWYVPGPCSWAAGELLMCQRRGLGWSLVMFLSLRALSQEAHQLSLRSSSQELLTMCNVVKLKQTKSTSKAQSWVFPELQVTPGSCRLPSGCSGGGQQCCHALLYAEWMLATY